MAVKALPNTGPGSLEYIPGTRSNFPGLNCVLSGDRVTFTGQSFKRFEPGISNVTPDANGYLPHFAIDPRYNREGAIDSVSIAQLRKQLGSPTSGTIDTFPTIRVDFGSIWLPYAAAVHIQGGDGPGSPNGVLLISLEWERRGWHQNYENQEISVIEKRDSKATFTVYKVSSGVDVPRPTNAIDVFTPDGVDLTLSNGPGTYNALAAMGPRAGGKPVPLGPFNVITPVGDVGSIVFTVQL